MTRRALLLLLLLAACGRAPDDTPAPGSGAAKGQPLPAFSMKTPDGRQVEFKPGTSKATVVEAWSPTWFPGADAQLRRLVELHERWGNKGVRILVVAYDEEPEAVAEALEGGGAMFDVGMGTEPVYQALRLEAVPTTWIVDSKGRVVERLEGYQPLDVLDGKLRKLLPPGAK